MLTIPSIVMSRPILRSFVSISHSIEWRAKRLDVFKLSFPYPPSPGGWRVAEPPASEVKKRIWRLKRRLQALQLQSAFPVSRSIDLERPREEKHNRQRYYPDKPQCRINVIHLVDLHGQHSHKSQQRKWVALCFCPTRSTLTKAHVRHL